MNMEPETLPDIPRSQRSGCLTILAVVLITIVITVAITTWVLTAYAFPGNFKPVELSSTEQKELDSKLSVFHEWTSREQSAVQAEEETQQPEKYTESDSDREVILSERELNAIVASEPDLAQRLFIDLSDNLASAKLLIPLDQDFPIMGGRNLKISAGMELAYQNERPVVILRGVKVMGVPMPAAWLGGLKNVDLVQEFGHADGFWQSFAEGIEYVRIQHGQLLLKLRE